MIWEGRKKSWGGWSGVSKGKHGVMWGWDDDDELGQKWFWTLQDIAFILRILGSIRRIQKQKDEMIRCFFWEDFSSFSVENWLEVETTLAFFYLRKYLSFWICNCCKFPFSTFFFYYCGLFWRCLSLSTLYKMYDPNYSLQKNALCFCDDMASNLSILTHILLTVVVSKRCAPYHGRNKIKQTFLLFFEQL